MAEINLRAYVSEIEDLVEHNQLDEAIAHCRHVLNIYPKHLETYRLLGKALLEQGRHSDAADIFQRIHSVAPDDFVSHVGMAIIREDEANLDGAIWHMERAFEVQSSNAVIQEELRRLYGRRDGLEPPKIQYTRGALARTYARGGLYAQAISELQAGLAEEPDRLDLKVLYGEVLWRNNQRPEAAEACTAVLEKLPYCRQANLVMADILQTSGQGDQAKFYRGRVEAVDPYEAFVLSSAEGDDAASVPDHAVRVPKFQWSPSGESERAGAGPEWMSALGISLQQPAPAGTVPDWLSEPVETPSAPAQPESSNWLADMTREAQAEPSDPADTGWLRALRAEAARAEPPPETPEPVSADWMGARERAEASPIEAAPAGGAPDIVPDWLRELESMEGEAAPATIVPGEPLPDWLRPAEPDTPPPLPPVTEPAASIADYGLPNWLDTEPAEPEAAPPVSYPSSVADLPDWMLPEAADEEIKSDIQATPTLPDWMRVSDLQPHTEPEAESPTQWGASAPAAPETQDDDTPQWNQPVTTSSGEGLPDWLTAARPAEAAAFRQPTPPEPEPAPPATNVPDWLKEALSTPKPAEVEAEDIAAWPASAPVEDDLPPASLARADVPDWLKAMAPAEDEAELSAAETDEPLEADLPPYLQEQEPGASDTIAGWLLNKPAEPAQPASSDEVPAWLQEALASPAPTTPENQWLADLGSQPQAAAPEAAEPPAPFMGDTGPLGASAPPAPFEAPAPPPEPAGIARPDFDMFESASDEPGETRIGVEDETLAWLESLAAKHGGQETEPEPLPDLPEPEASAKDMPDWLRTALAKQTDEGAEAEEIELPEPAAQPAAEALPDWLTPPENVEPAAPVSLSADPTEDEALAWLEALATRHGGEEAALPAVQGETAGMEGAVPMATDSETAALGGDEDEALAWLEALASKHGVKEEDVPPTTASAKPEAEETPAADAVPSWLMATRLLKQEPTAPAVPAAKAEEPEEEATPTGTPAWPGDAWKSEVAAPADDLPEAIKAEALPDWLRDAAPEGEVPSLALPGSEDDSDEALAWLESLAAKHGVPEEEMTLPAEARRDDMPDWLKAAEEPEPSLEAVPDWLMATKMLKPEEEAERLGAALETPVAAEPEAAPAEALPDWMTGPTSEPEETLIQRTAPEALPDWLAATTVVVPEPEAEAIKPTPAESLPDWLAGARPTEPEAEAAETALPAEGEDDAALAWLEALAAKHGASDDEMVMPAETRSEEMPDWLRESAAEPAAEEPALAMTPEVPSDFPPYAEIMAETEAAAAPEESAPAMAEQPALLGDEEGLAWLEALAAKHGAKDEELVTPTEARSEEMPAWLRESLTEETSEEPALPAVPEPVMETPEPTPGWQTPAQATPGKGTEGELPSWLQSAMTEPEAEEPAFAAPAQPAEPLPDWLSQAQTPPESDWEPAAEASTETWPEEFWPPASEDEARVMQTPPAELAQAAEPVHLSEAEETRLANARTWLQTGQKAEALGVYEGLINSYKHLDVVVADLEAAASQGTADRRFLRTLGDAYMRQDRLQKALDIYHQALSA